MLVIVAYINQFVAYIDLKLIFHTTERVIPYDMRFIVYS